MSKVVIIGGGAAGMMAGIIAARAGHAVTIFEKNEKCGKKVYITGKGRCNLTNAGDMDDLLNSIVTNKKFMYSALNQFSNYDVMGFFDELGLAIKVERGNRVFPESDKSSDVIGCLVKELNNLGVNIRYHQTVKSVAAKDGCFSHIVLNSGEKVYADNVIIATGGYSYQSTGSTGDGYEFAKKLGHTISSLSPALVPFNACEEYVKELQGLSLRNVGVTIKDGDKEVYSDFGELLFTHFGVSGPTVLSASSLMTERIKKNNLKLIIDLKPALDEAVLDERILHDFKENNNKSIKNALDRLYPKKLIPVMIRLSGIDENKRINEVSRAERERLLYYTKNFPVTLSSLRGYNEAIITQGGVNVKEINPSTMESKLVKGVYFAGEVIDVDAVTGGFNLQIAWSSGYAAANAIPL
ncbi:MAG: NAD(P)/FAD-dependent oxidoreductase [Lachnospiraceae bacterium]